MGVLIDLETRRLLVGVWRQELIPEDALAEIVKKQQLNEDEKRKLLVILEAVAEKDKTVNKAEEEIRCILPEELVRR
jgi:hypothetical protein